MRRMLLYFSLLAVTLIGVGRGVGTLGCMLGAQPVPQSVQWAAPSRDTGPRRCHDRHVLPPFAPETTRVASRLARTLTRKEPDPCPGFALGTVASLPAPRYARRALAAEAQPVALPPPLKLNCVLRI
jgi:hypothetical protein